MSAELNTYRRALPRLTKMASTGKLPELDRQALLDALPAVRVKADEHDAWSASLSMARREHVGLYGGICQVCQVQSPCAFLVRMERDEP